MMVPMMMSAVVVARCGKCRRRAREQQSDQAKLFHTGILARKALQIAQPAPHGLK
jgi:hypothetical protein